MSNTVQSTTITPVDVLNRLAIIRELTRAGSPLSEAYLDYLRTLPTLPRSDGPDGRRFPWGAIRTIHSVGDIQVVEFERDCSNLSSIEARVNHGQVQYHAYVNHRDTHDSYNSLDSALVGAIAYKRRGPNSQAAENFDLITLGVIPD